MNELRKFALQLTISRLGEAATPDRIIEEAQKYYDWMTKDGVPPQETETPVTDPSVRNFRQQLKKGDFLF